MKALVISGGGSKGAFAGGVAEFLIEEKKKEYDLFIGTSTGSLLMSHLALANIPKIKDVYTSVNQKSIFNNCPFKISYKNGLETISINHKNVIKNFIRGSKTFGESKNLLKLIKKKLTIEEFNTLKASDKDVVVTVSNLSRNRVEYKSVKDFEYDDFCDWIWISCNYIPFMSLVTKENCEYADGGLGAIVPIEEAINRGAKEIDVIVLETKITKYNRVHSKNPFELLTNTLGFILDRLEHQNIKVGTYSSQLKGVKLNIYHTPSILTTNSLIFNKKSMEKWWQDGFNHAQKKDTENVIQ